MSRMIIGFGAKRERGKDTAVNIAIRISENSGHPARRDAFAYPLKETCRIVFGFTDEQLYGKLKGAVDPFWGFTPRWAMQQVGTEMFRKHIGSDVWVRSLVHRAQEDSPDTHLMISDVRFENEARAIQALGGKVVRCDREVPFDPEIDNHASEVALDNFNDWDAVLDNNGSLDNLRRQVSELITKAWSR